MAVCGHGHVLIFILADRSSDLPSSKCLASASFLFLFSVYQQTSNSIVLRVDNGNVAFVPHDGKKSFLWGSGVNKKPPNNVIFVLFCFFPFEHFDIFISLRMND